MNDDSVADSSFFTATQIRLPPAGVSLMPSISRFSSLLPEAVLSVYFRAAVQQRTRRRVSGRSKPGMSRTRPPRRHLPPSEASVHIYYHEIRFGASPFCSFAAGLRPIPFHIILDTAFPEGNKRSAGPPAAGPRDTGNGFPGRGKRFAGRRPDPAADFI